MSNHFICLEKNSGFIPTLNNMGYMTSTLDLYSQKFVKLASKCKGTVVDIGAAYGIATLAALKAGKCQVVANDIEQGHLDHIRKSAKKDKERLTLKRGSFPDKIQ